ncbi:hypothetical protein Lesp01_85350 [Lentzea sp. NBRC 102530]|nr:hypothetical protein Lesp01_85350 [Lentzea sp. NBRC 102530]
MREAEVAMGQARVAARVAHDAAVIRDRAGLILTVPSEEPVEVQRMRSETAVTEVLTYANGERVVRKRNDRHGYDAGFDPIALSDAEELTPLVLQACGLRAAAVTRSDKAEVHMEFIEGQTVEALQMSGQDTSTAAPGSRQGKLLGLADAVVSHGDRNEGNVILTPSGDMVGIDNGDAYQHWKYARSPYANYLYNSDDLDERAAVPNEFTAADMERVGRRLAELRPAFVAVGREAWHDDMMRRHGELAAQARGSVDLIAP